MSDEMVDRVAIAMEQAMVSSSPEQSQCSRDLSRIMARAAIEAMNTFLIESQRKAQDQAFAENQSKH